MDNTRLVTELCAIIDRMNVILQAQAMELAQLHALHHEEEIAAVRRDTAEKILDEFIGQMQKIGYSDQQIVALVEKRIEQ